MITDIELAKMLTRCDSDPNYFGSLSLEVQLDLKHFCREIIKYGGTTHAMAGGKVFTDNTLLRPAKNLVKSLKRKKEEKGEL